ncbi:DUF4238 domain-containing protein [Kangiella sp. M94]
MTARHHHYLSQCYLKGFTKGGSKKSKLSIIDFRQRRYFETKPRNVGGIRDFNRIDVEGVHPNVLEMSLAEFEREAATALKKLDKGVAFDGEIREVTLALIALLAVRSPERREHMRSFEAEIITRVMDLSLESKERWESQVLQMKESGQEVNDSITYEEVKAFHESKAYSIEVAREHHIHMEFVQFEAILPYLERRNWLILKAKDESGPFITTDNPVNLTWKDPARIPPFYKHNPGFGLKETQVYFPVSKGVALIGEFQGSDGVIDAPRTLVANLNSKLLNFFYKQVYAPTYDFNFYNQEGVILSGKHLLKDFGS